MAAVGSAGGMAALAALPCSIEGRFLVPHSSRIVYEIGDIIGSCLYGKVRMAAVCEIKEDGNIWRTSRRVALKVMDQRLIATQASRDGVKLLENPRSELQVMQALSSPGSPYILRLESVLVNEQLLVAVLEYCELGELYSFVHNAPTKRVDASIAKYYITHILRGVAYMHQCGFAHCDLSLENVLLSEGHVAKLIDFGLTLSMPRARGSYCLLPARGQFGKLFYMAPEVYAGNVPFYGDSVDMWSCGIILFIMLIGAPPYRIPSPLEDERCRMIQDGQLGTLLEMWHVRHLIDDWALDLIMRLLSFDPLHRPSAVAALQHQWLGGAGIPDTTRPAIGFEADEIALAQAAAAAEAAVAAAAAAAMAAEAAGSTTNHPEEDDVELELTASLQLGSSADLLLDMGSLASLGDISMADDIVPFGSSLMLDVETAQMDA